MTNYYLKENNIITQSANFKFDKNCLETEEKIVRYDGQLMLASEYSTLQQTPEYIAEQLAKAKADKLQENITKRDEYLLAGVVYKDVLFDSDTDQKINLQFYIPNMNDTDTVIWFGKDNQQLECTKEDLLAIGGLIGSLTVKVWSVQNPAYIEQINNAKTIEELNAININYN